MIKVVAVLKRRPGLAVADFRAHWLNEHTALVRRLPGLRRYVQSHTLDGGYRRGEPAADGVAEAWFDDTDALRRLKGTPELAAVREDLGVFIAPGECVEVVTDEHVVKDGAVPAAGVKNIEFVKRRPGMPVDAFQRYWTDVHGPLGSSIRTIVRYVQSHTRRAAYRDGRSPPLDGFALTWFESTDAMRASAESAEYAATRADERNFIAGELDFIITREHVLFD